MTSPTDPKDHDPDDHDGAEWFDHTGLDCYIRPGRRRPNGHLTHRPDGLCNWCQEPVKPPLRLNDDLGDELRGDDTDGIELD